MKKILVVTFVGVLILLNLSMSWDPTFGILNQEDLNLEKNQDGPALQSVPGKEPSWESYNQWQCFPLQSVEARCNIHCETDPCTPENEYEVPTLSVLYEGHDYEFDHDFGDQCQEIVEEWKRLFDQQEGACIYAAFLQKIDDDASLWTLYNVKTRKGVWRDLYLPYADR